MLKVKYINRDEFYLYRILGEGIVLEEYSYRARLWFLILFYTS